MIGKRLNYTAKTKWLLKLNKTLSKLRTWIYNQCDYLSCDGCIWEDKTYGCNRAVVNGECKYETEEDTERVFSTYNK